MLEEQINNDIKESILKHQEDRLDALRQIKSSIQVEKAKNGSQFLTDEQIIKIIQKMVSQCTDSELIYRQKERFDLAEHELIQISFYKKYLPVQLSIEDITNKVKEIINQLGATTVRDMGKVMSECTKVFAGGDDNKTVGQIVKTQLNQ